MSGGAVENIEDWSRSQEEVKDMATIDLTELRVYQVAMQVGEDVWSLVDGWAWLAKQSVGLQWIRSADSIAANISEGYGRYSFKENARFCYYARGSLRRNSDLARRRQPIATSFPQSKADELVRCGSKPSAANSTTTSIRSAKPIPAFSAKFGLKVSAPNIELPPLEEFLAAHASQCLNPLDQLS